MPALKHVHSYIRMNKRFMKCADPKCTHYVAKELILGKESLCPLCHKNTFILDREALRRSVPRCFDCSDTKSAKQARERIKLLKDIGIDFESLLEVKES